MRVVGAVSMSGASLKAHNSIARRNDNEGGERTSAATR